ncbi:MAG: DUF2726 domain-containing protein [Deltaproteobacteria bacterium]|nr:DUF2726 domain-containing protein [Deltaproteobacteria bacterium]
MNLYKKLTSHWHKYVEVYPQIPVRNVIGYKELEKLPLSEKAIEYLKKTEFDFVVCALGSAAPILAIEFDGLCGGFSKDGQYISKVTPINDPYRRLKLSTKLEACLLSATPLVVLSFEECELLNQSRDMLMVIDAIIGQALEHEYYKHNYSRDIQKLTEAFEIGGGEAAEMYTIEMAVNAERMNPIKQKTQEIVKKFPFWGEQIIFPTKKGGHIEGRFCLYAGLEIKDGKSKRQILASIDLSMRDINFYGCSTWEIFNSIGEYCLARKVETQLGADIEKWKHAIENAPWVDK